MKRLLELLELTASPTGRRELERGEAVVVLAFFAIVGGLGWVLTRRFGWFKTEKTEPLDPPGA